MQGLGGLAQAGFAFFLLFARLSGGLLGCLFGGMLLADGLLGGTAGGQQLSVLLADPFMPRLAAGLLASQFGLQMLAAGAQLKALAQHGEGSARGLPAGGIARERQQLGRRLRACQ